MSFIEIEAEFIKQEATFLGAIAAVRIEDPTDEAFWSIVFSSVIPDKKIAFIPIPMRQRLKRRVKSAF
jgi:hypothetical protein